MTDLKKLQVYKFGGSSLVSAEGIERCLSFCTNKDHPLLVVVSAMGKTTNALEQVFYYMDSSQVSLAIESFNQIVKSHLLIAKELNLSSSFEKKIEDCSREVFSFIEKEDPTPKNRDWLLSRGEILSSLIFQAALSKQERSVNLFAGDVIHTDNDFGSATFVTYGDHEDWVSHLKKNEIIITQGFIGSNKSAEITTLGREGSDYSATLLGSLFKAQKVTIFTDVEGVFHCDPRFSKRATCLEYLSYEQASLLAENGAKVLFPKTLFPAAESNIPVLVRSSLIEDSRRTLISNQEYKAPGKFIAFTWKKIANGADFFFLHDRRLDEDLLLEFFPEGKSFDYNSRILRFHVDQDKISQFLVDLDDRFFLLNR